MAQLCGQRVPGAERAAGRRNVHVRSDGGKPAAAAKVPLPNTGMNINRVTLGTMTSALLSLFPSLPVPHSVRESSSCGWALLLCRWGQQNSEKEAHDQLDLAFHGYGVYSLDTACAFSLSFWPPSTIPLR